jgi:hypothetical protein
MSAITDTAPTKIIRFTRRFWQGWRWHDVSAKVVQLQAQKASGKLVVHVQMGGVSAVEWEEDER